MVDVWAEYARLRDEEGWIQEKIAKAKGATQKWVSERLKYHDKMPEEIKEIMRQEKITEGHLEKISILCVDAYFHAWLTTEQLWIDLAELAIDIKKLTGKKLFCIIYSVEFYY